MRCGILPAMGTLFWTSTVATWRVSAVVLSAGLIASTLAACGDEKVAKSPTLSPPPKPAPPPNSGKRLSRKEAFTISAAVTAGHLQCSSRAGRVPESELRELVEDLVALAREKPDDIGTAVEGYPLKTPRSGLREVTGDLEKGGCVPAVAAQSRAALDALP